MVYARAMILGPVNGSTAPRPEIIGISIELARVLRAQKKKANSDGKLEAGGVTYFKANCWRPSVALSSIRPTIFGVVIEPADVLRP